MKSFVFNYPVRVDDLDFMAIVGNAEWVTLLTRARMELLDKIEFPITEMIKQKVGGVVANLSIKFKKPAYYGDSLKITINPDSPFKKGLVLKYLIENQKNEECLSADVTIIFIDEKSRPVEMPEEIALRLFDLDAQNLN